MWAGPQHKQRPERHATCCAAVARHVSWCCLADTNANEKRNTPYKHHLPLHCACNSNSSSQPQYVVCKCKLASAQRTTNSYDSTGPGSRVFVLQSKCQPTTTRLVDAAKCSATNRVGQTRQVCRPGNSGHMEACAAEVFTRTHSDTRHATAKAAAQADGKKLPCHHNVYSRRLGWLLTTLTAFDNHAACQPTPRLGCTQQHASSPDSVS